MASKAPFSIGQKVVCIDDNYANRWEFSNSPIKKNGVYTVSHIQYYPQFSKWYLKLEEEPDRSANYWAKKFAPYNPYHNMTSEIAQQFKEHPDTVDQPVKVLEVQN